LLVRLLRGGDRLTRRRRLSRRRLSRRHRTRRLSSGRLRSRRLSSRLPRRAGRSTRCWCRTRCSSGSAARRSCGRALRERNAAQSKTADQRGECRGFHLCATSSGPTLRATQIFNSPRGSLLLV